MFEQIIRRTGRMVDAQSAVPWLVTAECLCAAPRRFCRHSIFIDGRAEPYGQTYILRHDRALSLRNLPDFLRLLEEYRIGATLFALSTPAVALLDRLPDWKRVYADDIAVVHMVR